VRSGIERAVDLVGRATSWLTLAIVALMATNVVLRYLFSIGSVWAQELEWHLLVPLIMLGIPYALLKGDHVRVDVLFERLPPAARGWIEVVSQVLAILIALAFVWLSLSYVQQSFAVDEKSADPGGLSYRWLLKSLLPLGFALLALQSFAKLLGVVEALRALARTAR
jgi:TRAP-type mannitol/chloroaromatic compound transport system permease small subunit